MNFRINSNSYTLITMRELMKNYILV